MITYIFLLVCGVDLLFKIHRGFLLRTRERAVVLLAKPPGTESVKDQTNIIDREHFKITPCCDIGIQWIKNRERVVKKG